MPFSLGSLNSLERHNGLSPSHDPTVGACSAGDPHNVELSATVIRQHLDDCGRFVLGLLVSTAAILRDRTLEHHF